MLQLTKGARPDEIFHIQAEQPVPTQWSSGPFRRTTWSHLALPDWSPGTFVSYWIGRLQYYHGTAKCDATRTVMLNTGELGEPTPGYVITTTPSEMHAFRWRTKGPEEPVWTNMGGS